MVFCCVLINLNERVCLLTDVQLLVLITVPRLRSNGNAAGAILLLSNVMIPADRASKLVL